MKDKLPKDKIIVLFDGSCNFCDRSVQFIYKRDKKDLFRFASLQSEIGIEICKYIGLDTSKVDSLVVYEPGVAYYTKSEAAFTIAKHLSGWPKWVRPLSFMPKPTTDVFYDLIARNRYKWFGNKEQCEIPDPSLMMKFL